jgi:hypothetical protein
MNRRKGSTGAASSRHGSMVDDGADADLARMGYKSKLPRSLSMLSVLGLSFAIMAGVFLLFANQSLGSNCELGITASGFMGRRLIRS